MAELIRNMPTPRAALQEATRRQRQRRHDWFDVNVGIMDAVLEEKFTQHAELRRSLLGTGDKELIEASPVSSGVPLRFLILINVVCFGRLIRFGAGERTREEEMNLERR